MIDDVLSRLGLSSKNSGVVIGAEVRGARGAGLSVRSPIDGSIMASVQTAGREDVELAIERAHEAFLKWRVVPAPKRGQFVRGIGERLRGRKGELAALVSWEAGKILQESLGEVQEMIDICDFAVGLSRQLYG